MGCFESKPDSRPEPTAVRGCTDLLWLIIFVIFWIVMVRTQMFNFHSTTPFSHLKKVITWGWPAQQVVCEFIRNKSKIRFGKLVFPTKLLFHSHT